MLRSNCNVLYGINICFTCKQNSIPSGTQAGLSPLLLQVYIFGKQIYDKFLADVGFFRIVDQLYALQLVHRANGASGYNIGVPVGFERDGRIFIYNHYRIIVHYHGNSKEESSAGVSVACIVPVVLAGAKLNTRWSFVTQLLPSHNHVH